MRSLEAIDQRGREAVERNRPQLQALRDRLKTERGIVFGSASGPRTPWKPDPIIRSVAIENIPDSRRFSSMSRSSLYGRFSA